MDEGCCLDHIRDGRARSGNRRTNTMRNHFRRTSGDDILGPLISQPTRSYMDKAVSSRQPYILEVIRFTSTHHYCI